MIHSLSTLLSQVYFFHRQPFCYEKELLSFSRLAYNNKY